MKVIVTIAAGMLIAGPCAAQQAPAFTFRGHQIGQALTTPDRIVEGYHYDYKKADFTCQKLNPLQTFCYEVDRNTNQLLNNIGGVKITRLVYLLRNNALSMVLMTFPTDSYDTLKDMLVGKYGAPASDTIETYHNRMNAEFQGHVLIWKFAEGDLTFSQVGDSLDEGRLGFEAAADKEADTAAAQRAAEATGKEAF